MVDAGCSLGLRDEGIREDGSRFWASEDDCVANHRVEELSCGFAYMQSCDSGTLITLHSIHEGFRLEDQSTHSGVVP